MASGIKTLHQIDAAIERARKAASEAAVLPKRTGEALITVKRRQAEAYAQIAADRLDLLERGEGGDLGYVDRQAEKLLASHAKQEASIETKIEAGLETIRTLEAKRRTDEKTVAKAIDDYDKAAAAAETKLLKNPFYLTQLSAVEDAEATLIRAGEKLAMSREDEMEKGEPYRKDPFFSYLQNRQYGTKKARGWFLTKFLDRWVASKINYRQAAENYRRLTAIPARLEHHVKALEDKAAAEKTALETLESDMLKAEGVTAMHEASLAAQKNLEETDDAIEAAEEAHQALREEHTLLTSGESGPHREAVKILSEALQRKDLPSLRRLAAQTETRDDDRAIEELRELAGTARDLRDDQEEAQNLLKKYQRTLKELEKVRRRFKKSRYDAPSSTFGDGNLIGALLMQVLSGVLSGKDFWRQLERAQRTVRRYSDNDFGGIDWTEGLRLPRGSGRRRSGWGGFPTGGGWGGGFPSRGGGGYPRRTSIPRMPRQSLPKIRVPRGGKSGGFRTGGGF